MSSTVVRAPTPAAAEPSAAGHHRGGITHALRAELRKLTMQSPARLLALVCLLGPFAFGAVLSAQNGVPADTLFGVWVHSSGFAV